MATVPKIDVGADYKEKYGFFVPEEYVFKAKRGLNPEIVKEISWMKQEPEWMTKMRLRSLEIFRKKPMPTWGADLSVIDFENIFYYLKASDKQSKSWEDLPPDIKATYDRLGVPEAERKFLAGVSAQYESEVVYHSLQKELTAKGVIFTDTDSALRDHPELFKKYFGTVIPPADNKFAALNTAVWSGGSFIYVPKGVRVDIPLQAYFRINAENMGQFERTLIICDEGSFVHYIEGCTAPIYTTDSLHSAVVEIIVMKTARCRYTTIQNWSTNVFNLVTKRAMAYADATMEWVDGNLGCLAAGTLVDTDVGPKPIEAVAVGDRVWSRDATGEMILQRVTATKVNPPRPTWRLETSKSSVVATDNHPFLVRREANAPLEWRPLSAIRSGDELLVAGAMAVEDGQHNPAAVATLTRPQTSAASVTAIVPDAEQPTYDIEVDGTANFVANGIVAHNSQITMKYPSVYLMEPGAKGDVLSVAFAGKGQHQDAGGKMIHVAPNTTSTITSKSISKAGGRTSYRGHIKMYPGATNSKSFVKCDALLLDDNSRSDTYPYNDVDADNVTLGHEATVSKVSDEQLFYLMSRGITRAEAETMIVNGFIEPFTKELPLEYAVELNRLIQLEMEGSVG
jgi:Fe-S cluster assembly scaffold protein SufB